MNEKLKAHVRAAMAAHERKQRIGVVRRGKPRSFCSCGWEPDEQGARDRADATKLGDNARMTAVLHDIIGQWSDHTVDVVLGATAAWLDEEGYGPRQEMWTTPGNAIRG